MKEARETRYAKEFLAGLYRTLWAIRVFEARCIKLYRKGIIRGYLHPYLGEEAIALGVCAALRRDDYIASTHRGHGRGRSPIRRSTTWPGNGSASRGMNAW